MLLPTIRIAEICLSILFARINSPITLRVTFILPPQGRGDWRGWLGGGGGHFKKLVKMFCCWSKEILREKALTFEEIHRLSSILKFGQIYFWSKYIEEKMRLNFNCNVHRTSPISVCFGTNFCQ
jgi:hypothetical protein